MLDVDFFRERLGRLKVALRARKDKEVAEALGLGEKAFNARKARNSFPEKELRALAQQRPELGIDVEYVLTGGTLTQRERDHLESARAMTLQLPVEEAEKQRLLTRLEDGFLQQATQNLERQLEYTKLLEMLNSCSDESLRLVLLTTEKFHLADLAAKRGAKAA